MAQASARDVVLETFRWVEGHADVWRLFSDADAFHVVVERLAEIAVDAAATKVAGIESRGFILGGAVAATTGLGFVPIRKEAGLFPGRKIEAGGATWAGLALVVDQLPDETRTALEPVTHIVTATELGPPD